MIAPMTRTQKVKRGKPRPMRYTAHRFTDPITANRDVPQSNKFIFAFDCVGARESIIRHLTRNATSISYSTFVKHADLSPFHGLRLSKDWHVAFYRSRLPDETPVYYFVHSGIEHVFTPVEYRVDLDALEARAEANDAAQLDGTMSRRNEFKGNDKVVAFLNRVSGVSDVHGLDGLGTEQITADVEAVLDALDDLGFPDVRAAVADYRAHPYRGFFGKLRKDIDSARWNSDDEDVEAVIKRAHELVDALRRALPRPASFGALAGLIR